MYDNAETLIAFHMISKMSMSRETLENYGITSNYLPGIWSKVADIRHVQNNHTIILLWVWNVHLKTKQKEKMCPRHTRLRDK